MPGQFTRLSWAHDPDGLVGVREGEDDGNGDVFRGGSLSTVVGLPASPVSYWTWH